MTEQELRIAIAEFCGWTNVHLNGDGKLIGNDPSCLTRDYYFVVPDYPHDLNLIHEVEWLLFEKQRKAGLNLIDPMYGVYSRYIDKLIDLCSGVYGGSQTASAASRAVTIHCTIGKWKE